MTPNTERNKKRESESEQGKIKQWAQESKKRDVFLSLEKGKEESSRENKRNANLN